MRTLVIEDDPQLSKLLKKGLVEEGFSVDLAEDGEEGLFLAEGDEYDAIVLDLMIPKLPGERVLERLRRRGRATPVLILTARDADEDKVRALNSGADDYVTKPFKLAELVARLRALIRRSHRVASPTIKVGDLELDLAARRVTRGRRVVELQAKPFALLELLALNKGRVVTRARIYEHIYASDDDTLSNVLDVHVCKLREAIEAKGEARLIHTVRGQGYVLEER